MISAKDINRGDEDDSLVKIDDPGRGGRRLGGGGRGEGVEPEKQRKAKKNNYHF